MGPRLSLCAVAERDPLHQGLIVQRSKLRGRDFAVDLASRLGKTQVGRLRARLRASGTPSSVWPPWPGCVRIPGLGIDRNVLQSV